MTMTKRRVEPPTSADNVPERAYREWHSGTGKVIRRGDVVRVDKERGRFVVQWFRAEQAGTVAVVIGGPSGHRTFRAFTVGRCTVDRRATKAAHGE